MEFDKPKNLNGLELRFELIAAGCDINDKPESVVVIGDKLFLEVTGDKKTIESVVANHNGTVTPKELTVAEKLASVGLDLDDLKSALGI
jgi:hypothetical protein